MQSQTISISRKVFLVFLASFIIEMFLFTFMISLATNNLTRRVTYDNLDHFLKTAKNVDAFPYLKELSGDTISYCIYDYSTSEYIIKDSGNFLVNDNDIEEVKNNFIVRSTSEIEHIRFSTKKGLVYGGAVKDNNKLFVAVYYSEGLLNNVFNVIILVLITFAIIFILGALIILVWVRTLVKRINMLKDFVEAMPVNNYKSVYVDNGDDELRELSYQINDMRRTVVNDETAKESMLQNVSHDLKTPIAVIRSYAEAIGDGIESIEATDLIIEQCAKLERKVKRFIDFNKLEYLTTDAKAIEPVNISEIILTIVNNCKHMTNITFEVSVDDTFFLGKYENYYTVFENLIENSIRYAKALIRITLKNGIFTIYNDGEHIDEIFIRNGFKPYEKGSQGKFGLGMSIVCRTLELFHMEIKPRNEEIGVTFIIKPKE